MDVFQLVSLVIGIGVFFGVSESFGKLLFEHFMEKRRANKMITIEMTTPKGQLLQFELTVDQAIGFTMATEILQEHSDSLKVEQVAHIKEK